MSKTKPDNLSTCPCCGAALVLPIGPPSARGLVVSEFPGEYELGQRRPFVPQAPAGRVFYTEMARAGLDADEFRVTNVWLHAPNKLCLDWHVEQLRREAHGKLAYLILGGTATSILLATNVMSVSGLVRRVHGTNAQLLSEGALFVAGPNPAACLRGGVGELRLALSRFAQAYRRLK